jgi:hypothetical protein
MILDSQLVLSDSQAVTATAISANVYDTNPISGPNATQDIGLGDPMWLVVSTAVTATDTSSDATLTITLESDTVAGLSSSPTVHYSSGAIAFASFATAGTRLVAIRLPAGAYKRYVGLRYTVAAGPLTAGQFDAYLTHDLQANVAMASGFTVQ